MTRRRPAVLTLIARASHRHRDTIPAVPIFEQVSNTETSEKVRGRGVQDIYRSASKRLALGACQLVGALFFALLIAGVAVPGSSPAFAEDDPAQTLDRLNRQLAGDQAKLAELNNRVLTTQAELDAINRKLAADHQREAQLNQELSDLARSQYQRPASSLTSMLDSQNADQMLSSAAESRLIAAKQQDLAAQAEDLRRQDEHARDQQATKVAEIQGARDEAAQVVTRTLALRDAANDAVIKARAQALADQAKATQTAASLPVLAALPVTLQGERPVDNHFPAGWCTYYVASRRNVPWWGDAIDWWTNARAYGYAEGQAPAVGAIMVTSESALYGHVAFVESVNPDGSWTVSEMNYVGWNVQSTRTIRPGQVPVVGFIYGKS